MENKGMEVKGQLPASPARGEGGKSPPTPQAKHEGVCAPSASPCTARPRGVPCPASVPHGVCVAELPSLGLLWAFGIWAVSSGVTRVWLLTVVGYFPPMLRPSAGGNQRAGTATHTLAFGVPHCKGQDGIPVVGLSFWTPHFSLFVVLFEIHYCCCCPCSPLFTLHQD